MLSSCSTIILRSSTSIVRQTTVSGCSWQSSSADIDRILTLISMEASAKSLRQRISAGELVIFETRHRRKDGTSFPVEVRVGQFEQGGRRFLRLVRDITERKSAEEWSRRSERCVAVPRTQPPRNLGLQRHRDFLYPGQRNATQFGALIRSRVSPTVKPCGNGSIQTIATECTHWSRRLCAKKETTWSSPELSFLMGTVKHLASTGHPLLAADGEGVENRRYARRCDGTRTRARPIRRATPGRGRTPPSNCLSTT